MDSTQNLRISICPLDNFLVLNEIFASLPPSSLQACRQVCHLWDQNASPHLSSKSVVQFKPDSFPVGQNFLSKSGNRMKCTLRVSLSSFKDPNLHKLLTDFGHKIINLEIHLDSVKFPLNLDSGADFQRIIESCRNLRELRLTLTTDPSAWDETLGQDFPPQFQKLLGNCSSLEKLSFDFELFSPWTFGLEYFKRFFDNFPNIVDLRFALFYNFLHPSKDAIEALKSRPDFVGKLKALSFGKEFGDLCGNAEAVVPFIPLVEDIQALSALGFKSLTKLDLQHVLPFLKVPEEHEIQEIFGLLENVSKTLKYLRMGSFFCEAATQFPCLPKLEELILDRGHVNADFFQKCPNLLTLFVGQVKSNCSLNDLQDCPLEWVHFFSKISNPIFLQTLRKERNFLHVKLQQLEIFPVLEFSSEDELQALLSFPALKVLKIKLGSGLLHNFINSLSQSGIEELELVFAPGENNFEAVMSKEGRTFADWKCLRKLCLINCRENKYPVKSITCFTLMKNVSSLELKKFEMRDSDLMIMLQEMKLVALTLSLCKVLKLSENKSEESFGEMFPHIYIHICEETCFV